MKGNFKMKNKLTPEEQVIGMVYIPIIAMNRVQSDKLSPKLDIKENDDGTFSIRFIFPNLPVNWCPWYKLEIKNKDYILAIEKQAWAVVENYFKNKKK